jgi:antitoxin ParD1/3/4
MAHRTNLNVSLTPELGRFVRQHVDAGNYQTASEVVREGLRLLEQQDRDHQAALEALKAKLDHASAQADRGTFVAPGRVLQRIQTLKRKRAVRKT